MGWNRVFFIVLVLVLPVNAVQITEFCPDPYLHDDPDEYLILSGSGSLDGITISDGEGGFRFPPGSAMNGQVTIALNAVAYNRTHGHLPDYEWYDSSPQVPDVISGDKLRMANARDELSLYHHGTLIQRVAWPADVKSREGQIHSLENGTWDRRYLFIGQTRFAPAVFSNVTVTVFTSPDSAGDVIPAALGSARHSVHVNVYEFTSMALARQLVDARERGADVLVLVEGGPVGGISPEEKGVLYVLNQSGIPTCQMAGVGDMKAPYRFDHAKYAVIDGRFVLLTTENFKGSGIPPPGKKGNRGWGVFIDDPSLATYFEQVFSSDIRNRNSVPAPGADGPAEPAPTIPFTAEFFPEHYYGATVIPVIAPDTSYLILDLINGAQQSIAIEQAYITNESDRALNPYLAAAINASRRGVHVRVLVDSYWYNVEDEKDNDEMVALINQIAACEKIPLEARCAELDLNNIEKIHTKGVIVDNRSVLVSSINWNSNSPNFNREAGVIITHEGAARYFRAVFDDDWQPGTPRRESASDRLRVLGLLLVLGVLATIYAFKKRRG